MKLKELLRGIEILSATADMETEIGDISYDSRRVRPSDLFVAVAGSALDGHRFIPDAVSRGAAAVLCQRPPEDGTTYVQVPDSRMALALAAGNYFKNPGKKMTLVGVTGTNGKTTSTQLIQHILETALGAKVGLIGTNGNRIGREELPADRTTPDSYSLQKLLARMAEAGCSHVVMELSSHALDQDRAGGLRYAAAVLTNLTQDHLDYHKTMEAYAAAKAKIFTMCDRAVLNLDDAWSAYFIERAGDAGKTGEKLVTYGIRNPAAGLRAAELELLPTAVRFRLEDGGGGRAFPVALGIPGRFSVYNALGALACCRCLGVDLPEGIAALADAPGVKGRMEAVPTDGEYTILIDYAHTPDALENVLRSVRETAKGRVVVLFGCGGDRDRGKRPLMGKLGTELADFAIITSDNPRTEEPEAIIREILSGVELGPERYIAITERPAAIRWAIEHHRPGDVIVLAGKGHETYQEVGHIKHHMDEREIVAEILRQRRLHI